MKRVTVALLLVLFTLSYPVSVSAGWGNDGRSTNVKKPPFRMHDWIALEGYKMA